MNNITQLFIRACKSDNAKVRLRSVYRRFYCKLEDMDRVDENITEILITIVEQVNPMAISKLFREMESYYCEHLSYKEKKQCVMISQLKLTEKSKLLGMRVPRRFRGA
jgi:hypothetical protein